MPLLFVCRKMIAAINLQPVGLSLTGYNVTAILKNN